MVTIGVVSFPTESSKEMGKRFMDIPPLPTYIARKGPYVGSELGVGIKLTKMAEAVEFAGNYYAHFIGVPGFTYTMDTWFEIKEAFKMIGLA